MSYSQEAIDFLHKGDLIGLQNTLAKALDNDSQEILADLAEYLQMMGFIDESHRIYEKLLSENPLSTAYLINLAEIAEDDGDLDMALNYLYQIPREDENYAAALVKIADLYQVDGDFETSLSKLEEAKEYSDSPLITFALAESYFENSDYQKAIAEYAKLSERKILHETKISIYQRIGEAYARLGNFENAISFLEKSYEFDKKVATLYETALLYSEIGNKNRSLSIFRKIEEDSDDFLNYELAYAQTLMEDNQVEKARDVAQKGIKKTPNSVPLLHLLSKINYQLNEKEMVEQNLMEALDQPELHDETVFLLANLYFNSEDYEAVIRLENLLEEEHPLAQWLIAQAYRYVDDEIKAAECYEQLIMSTLYDNPDFLSDAIDFFREVGKIEIAKSLIPRYLELVPDDYDKQALFEE